MDFKRLASFVRVAELGSLSRAADRMRIAQPALSRQMRMLEEEIGVPLLERHRRGMALTEAGEELRSRIVGPLRQLENAIQDVRFHSIDVGGNVAFGLPPTASYILAGPLARGVATNASNISLRVVEGYSAHLIDWLHRGEIDAALLYGPATDFQLKAEALLLEEILLVGPPDSGLDPNIAQPFSELAHLPMVLPSRPHGLRILADSAAAKGDVRLDVRFQADSFILMKDLVESGMGYSFLPLSAFNAEARAGRLTYAPIENPSVTRQLALATQPGGSPSRATRVLNRLVKHEIVKLVENGTWGAHFMFDPDDYRDPLPKT